MCINKKAKGKIWSLLAHEVELEWWVYITSFNNLLPNIRINKINRKKTHILAYMFLKLLKMVNFPLCFSEFYFSVLSSSSYIFIIAILSTAITAYIFLAACNYWCASILTQIRPTCSFITHIQFLHHLISVVNDNFGILCLSKSAFLIEFKWISNL